MCFPIAHGTVLLEQVSASNNVVQALEAHLRKLFAHFARNKSEVVHHVGVLADESFAKLFVLCGNACRTSVEVAFAHHDATQCDKGTCCNAELFGTEAGHFYHVVDGFQRPVGLYFNSSAQVVHYQCLLSFGKAKLNRHTGIFDRAGWAGTRSTFGTRYYNEVGMCFGYACSNSSYTIFGDKFNTYFCLRIGAFEVEYELCQILDRVNIVVRWR